MKKKSPSNPKNNFWSQLDSDIQIIGKRAKQNMRRHDNIIKNHATTFDFIHHNRVKMIQRPVKQLYQQQILHRKLKFNAKEQKINPRSTSNTYHPNRLEGILESEEEKLVNPHNQVQTQRQQSHHANKKPKQIVFFQKDPNNHLKKTFKNVSKYRLEQIERKEKQATTMLSNRIKYIELEREKNHRTISFARQKYERIMQIRSRSIQEKNEITKIRSYICEENQKEAHSKVERIRSERERTSISVSRIRMIHEEQAYRVRLETDSNQNYIKNQKNKSLELNKSRTTSVKESLDHSKQNHQHNHDVKIQNAKIAFRQKLMQKQTKNKELKNKNSYLLTQLKQKISLIEKDNEQTKEQLNAFSSAMYNKHENKNERRNSPAFKCNTNRSFYVTHENQEISG